MFNKVDQLLSLTAPPSWCNYGNLLLDTTACLAIYSILDDSYETNKEKALNILKNAPPHLLGRENKNSKEKT